MSEIGRERELWAMMIAGVTGDPAMSKAIDDLRLDHRCLPDTPATNILVWKSRILEPVPLPEVPGVEKTARIDTAERNSLDLVQGVLAD